MSDCHKEKQIVDMFLSRDERAIGEFEKLYKTLCLKVAYNITKSSEDTEECLNDLYLRLWDTIPPQNPISLKSYACEIIRNLALQCIRRKNAKKRFGVTMELEKVVLDVPYYTTEEIGEIIDAFLTKQPKFDSIVFVRRYFYSESVKDIAAKLGVTENKISKILSKQRKMLREELKKGGVSV